MTRIISERSEREIERAELESELEQAVLTLAANLLRVVANGGQDHLLIGQMHEVIKAHEALSGKSDRRLGPMLTLLAVKDWRTEAPEKDRKRWAEDGSLAVADAEDDLLLSALRVCAAKLAGPPASAARSKNDLSDALRRLDQARGYRANSQLERHLPSRVVREEIVLRQRHYLGVAKRDGTARKDTGHWTLRLAKRKDGRQEPGYGLEEKWKQYLEAWSLLER
jgi:hypothetical protein